MTNFADMPYITDLTFEGVSNVVLLQVSKLVKTAKNVLLLEPGRYFSNKNILQAFKSQALTFFFHSKATFYKTRIKWIY